jgi:hypothetical protein
MLYVKEFVVVEVSVFLAISFADACVVVRCFNKFELFTCTFLPLTSMNLK